MKQIKILNYKSKNNIDLVTISFYIYAKYIFHERSCINLGSCQLVVFTLGLEEYAIHISYAQEIIRVPALTKVPSIPEFIEGVFNLRGKVIPVIDLKKRFGFGESERNNDNRLLILELDGMKLGIVVDDVSEVLSIDEQSIENLSDEIVGISKNSVQGISLIDQRIIMILDAVALKSDIFSNNLEKELVS